MKSNIHKKITHEDKFARKFYGKHARLGRLRAEKRANNKKIRSKDMLKQEYQAPWIGHPADEKEPEPMYTCDLCESVIYEGDDYYAIDGITVCEDCVRSCRKTA